MNPYRHFIGEIEAINGPISEEIVSRCAEAYRKIRNTERFLISNLYDFDPGVGVLSRPGIAERAIAFADPTPLPGPDRAELLTLVGAFFVVLFNALVDIAYAYLDPRVSTP